MATLREAVDLCRKVEVVAPDYGCHVALTGGCLYKDGERKDIDLLFYRIRQVEKIDYEGLKAALGKLGIVNITGFGWLLKGVYGPFALDMFFPEEIDGGKYPEPPAEEPPLFKIPEQPSDRQP